MSVDWSDGAREWRMTSGVTASPCSDEGGRGVGTTWLVGWTLKVRCIMGLGRLSLTCFATYRSPVREGKWHHNLPPHPPSPASWECPSVKCSENSFPSSFFFCDFFSLVLSCFVVSESTREYYGDVRQSSMRRVGVRSFPQTWNALFIRFWAQTAEMSFVSWNLIHKVFFFPHIVSLYFFSNQKYFSSE